MPSDKGTQLVQIWKWVIYRGVSYKEYYKVSNLGELESVARKGQGPFTSKTFLMQYTLHNGYPQVSLHKNGDRVVAKVANIVLETFISTRPKGKECCHKNDIRDDSRLENLYWGTPKQNHADAKRNGKMEIVRRSALKGEDCHTAKVTKELVVQIRNLYNIYGKSIKKIARRFNLPFQLIYRIVVRQTWRWVE